MHGDKGPVMHREAGNRPHYTDGLKPGGVSESEIDTLGIISTMKSGSLYALHCFNLGCNNPVNPVVRISNMNDIL